MKRYVIHIKGSSRYNRMMFEMNNHYMNEFEIFDAIVKPKGWEGVSESFKQIIRENYNEPYIHIFEDDVKFTSKNSRSIFEHGFDSLPMDWDIYLGGSYTFKHSENLGGLLKIYDFSSLHNVVINKSCYDYFLSHEPNKINDIDRWVSQFKPNAYLCNPQIAIQYNGHSFNKGGKKNYDHFLVDKNIIYEN